MLIDKLHSQAIKLGIAPENKRYRTIEAFIPGAAHALGEFTPARNGKHIVQPIHALTVPLLGEPFQQPAADFRRGRLLPGEHGPAAFQHGQLIVQGIIGIVADFRRIQRMIPMVMVNHKRTELFQTFFIGILDQKGLQRPLIHGVILRCPAAEAKQSKTVPEAA